VEDLLVARFGADPAAKDVTRVLRLPGFLHLKDPDSPFLCRLLVDRLAEAPYRLGALRDALRPDAAAAGTEDTSSRTARTAAENRRADLDGVEQGQRNSAAARVAGRLLSGLNPELWETSGWGGLRQWNDRNRPPLPEAELRGVFDRVAGRERAGRREPTEAEGGNRVRAERLVRLVADAGVTLFLDQFREPHAHVRVGAASVSLKLRGKEFRQWLARQVWQKERAAVAQDVLSAAVLALEGRTRYEGAVRPLEQRVAWHEGAIWYDLADERGRAVRVTAGGWSVEQRVPILFRRAGHQAAQILPVRGGSLDALLPLVRFARPHAGPLLLAYLVTCLVPDIPHPVAWVTGPQGASKSTLCRLIRRLIDPTCLEGLSLPPRHELPQVLFRHWFASFDNVGAIPSDVSNVLCRAVTGEGISRRQLFSDDEDVIYQFRRCVCLNGIHLAARPDLLDRALHLPLERLQAEEVRDEASVLARFEARRPELLGALLDALAGAMKVKPALRPAGLPRMADFALWGAAAAEALGIGAGTFLALYADNVRDMHEEAVADSPVAFALSEYMATRKDFCGTATELLRALAESSGGGRGLPRSPSALMRHLHLLRVNLAQTGLDVDSRRTRRGRRIEIRKADGRKAAAASVQVARGDGSGDGGRTADPAPGEANNGEVDGGDGTPVPLPAADNERA
ncbi:MAG: primase C-terminal domain-containing protein, partial [Gemmataceae bacterium]